MIKKFLKKMFSIIIYPLFAVFSPFKKKIIDHNCTYIDLENWYPDEGGESYTNNLISKEPINDLTIIVPCYNVEGYIRECVESILNQKTN